MRPMLRFVCVLALVAGLGAITVTGCNRETTDTPEAGLPSQAEVVVVNNAFDPAVVTIAKGGTITWVNQDQIDYSLESAGLFEETLPAGQRWSYTFQTPGEYRVYDTITAQPSEMKVIVK